ncbi:hypothetical protein SASPL_132429 [Salvia splendens]|uniref:Xyloglucan endotransglucosylase/hydrolase n=1 Tax=Salvia splendens TaxID=180675 RepID=A0A8X8X369_SALSN|nr:hypothetical protein SASPL_132429 [Salvia splendens]
MANRAAILAIFAAFAMVGLANSSKFDQLFQPSWAFDHFTNEGEVVHMKLDNHSGAGFSSKSKYLFGKVTVQIKLVAGDSAGTMSSEGPYHNEFDFEFLGNKTGEPYLVQTNVYVNGVGNREQRLNLWFDPTKDFHSYSIFWNQRQVVFLVDETPVRRFGEDGLVPAPFVASYTGFEINACPCPGEVAATDIQKRCSSSAERRYWWDEPTVSELNVHQSHQLVWVRANHMVYDYCSDTVRFPARPAECEHHRH